MRMSGQKKHFYVVVKGRSPGIYTRWSGAGGAEEQVKGFVGAVYRGFVTREAAEAYHRSGGKIVSAPEPKWVGPELASAGGAPLSPPRLTEAPALEYQKDLRAGKVVIFTDGASTGNPGPGGYGAVILLGDSRKEISGGFRCTTNNRMELLGCITALRELDHPTPVILYSDSQYVVNAVQKGWARRWQKNGWMRRPSADGQSHPAENVDLWEEMLGLLDRLEVEFRWVKGHAEHPENERCDVLAVQAAHRRGLPPDPGFRGKC